MAGMLNGALPLFAAAVAAIFARRMPSGEMLLGLSVGLVGVVLIALPNLGAGRSSLDGVLLILIAITLYGIAINVARPLQMRFGALPVLARSLGLATILTAPLGLPEVLHGHWSLVPLLSLIALGALGTGIAYVLSTTAAGRLGATRASATIFIASPIAMLLGVVVLHEEVGMISLIGAGVCIGGAWMIRKAQEHATQSPRGPV
jgi:drug/metabolite transporter (DMT)-like permease